MIFNLIGFFGGFLVSSIIDSTLSEFSEWAIVGAALVIATLEAFSNIYYSYFKRIPTLLRRGYYVGKIMTSINSLKIGIIYGLIVDAFKLGS